MRLSVCERRLSQLRFAFIEERIAAWYYDFFSRIYKRARAVLSPLLISINYVLPRRRR